MDTCMNPAPHSWRRRRHIRHRQEGDVQSGRAGRRMEAELMGTIHGECPPPGSASGGDAHCGEQRAGIDGGAGRERGHEWGRAPQHAACDKRGSHA